MLVSRKKEKRGI